MQESKCCPFKFFMTLFHDNGDVGEKFGGVRLKPFAESTCAGANQIARLHGGRQSGQGTSPAENTTHEHRQRTERILESCVATLFVRRCDLGSPRAGFPLRFRPRARPFATSPSDPRVGADTRPLLGLYQSERLYLFST
jgi:hypothetical protein